MANDLDVLELPTTYSGDSVTTVDDIDDIDFGNFTVDTGEANHIEGSVAFGDEATYGEIPNLSDETRCEFITGVAGSGKSYTIKQRLEADPAYAVLAASTGIAAINLNATTIHSLLGFFDTDSLRDAYLKGAAQRKLRQLVDDGFKNVVLDEISMIGKDTLDLIVRVFDDVNTNLGQGQKPIGMVASGDFMQLPPIADKPPGQYGRAPRGQKVPPPWAFEGKTWHRFELNTMRLTKIWRQSDERFLAALNYARSGQGQQVAAILASAGVQFHTSVDMDFDGTTLVGKNDEVDRFNQIALDRVQGYDITLPARRWGIQRTEWKNIPDKTALKKGAYVMILSNKYDGGSLIYANGDCGHVVGVQPSDVPGVPPSLIVELVRTGSNVCVDPIVRGVEQSDKPADLTVEISLKASDPACGQWLPKGHFRGDKKTYVSGQVQYWPVRLAYATTVHKCQGLSLDRVQIDCRSWMMANPAMLYVALSRCRTLEGLRIVGQPEVLAAKCNIDEKVRRWL